MLSRLFHFRRDQRIRLVDFPQTIEHLRQFRRSDRFDGDFENSRGDVLDRPEDVELVFDIFSSDGGGFRDGSVDTGQQYKITSARSLDIDRISKKISKAVFARYRTYLDSSIITASTTCIAMSSSSSSE
jgi:hypothetical protein